MSVFTTLVVSLAVVALSTLVAGDPGVVIRIDSANITNYPNDYFEPWTVDIDNEKGYSVGSMKMAAKIDVPETLMVKSYVVMGDLDPFEATMTFCEGLQNEVIGRSFTRAGVPKGQFPTKCPYIAGDWGIANWKPPTEKIPPGIPECRMSGYLQLFEEGKEPYMQLDYEGELKYEMPKVGL